MTKNQQREYEELGVFVVTTVDEFLDTAKRFKELLRSTSTVKVEK